MATVELERTLVKSPPELWEEISSAEKLGTWLGEIKVTRSDPPSRLEWGSKNASGVIELEASGWGTKIRAQATPQSSVIARLAGSAKHSDEIERRLDGMLDALCSSSLKSG